MVGFAADVPVVVTRVEDGRLRGFVNVCRHRGHKVAAEDTRNCRRLVCRYHSWSYQLDGRLANAPGSANDPDFPNEKLGLLPVAVDRWGPMILVNADPNAVPFVAAYPELDRLDHRMDLDAGRRYSFYRAVNYEAASNWKIWYDNFLECYHCANIHAGSFAAAYAADLGDFYSASDERVKTSHYLSNPKSAIRKHLQAKNHRTIEIFPGIFMLQQDEWMILAQIRPTGPETTQHTVHYLGEVGASASRLAEWFDIWHQTFLEDKEVTNTQQQMLRSGAMDRSRLMENREPNVVLYNRLICKAYKAHIDKGVPAPLPGLRSN